MHLNPAILSGGVDAHSSGSSSSSCWLAAKEMNE